MRRRGGSTAAAAGVGSGVGAEIERDAGGNDLVAYEALTYGRGSRIAPAGSMRDDVRTGLLCSRTHAMTKGRAKLAMAQGLGVWVLEAPDGFGEAAEHAHHAIQISVCLSGALAITSGGITLERRVLAVAADARHGFEAHGLLVFLFVEPESRFGRILNATLFRDRPLVALDETAIAELVEPLRATFDAALDTVALLGVGRAAVAALAQRADAPPPDPRVQRIIDYAANHLDRPLSLTAAAAGIYLSPSRLRHLFVEQTGLAFRTWLLWLRLVRAVEIYAEGRSLTEASHAAGFSDSAHFSRVFKRTFGLPATALTRL